MTDPDNRTLEPGIIRASSAELLIVPATIMGTTPIKSESCDDGGTMIHASH